MSGDIRKSFELSIARIKAEDRKKEGRSRSLELQKTQERALEKAAEEEKRIKNNLRMQRRIEKYKETSSLLRVLAQESANYLGEKNIPTDRRLKLPREPYKLGSLGLYSRFDRVDAWTLEFKAAYTIIEKELEPPSNEERYNYYRTTVLNIPERGTALSVDGHLYVWEEKTITYLTSDYDAVPKGSILSPTSMLIWERKMTEMVAAKVVENS